MFFKLNFPWLSLSQRRLKLIKRLFCQVLTVIQSENSNFNNSSELPEFVPVTHIKNFLNEKKIDFVDRFSCLTFECSYCSKKDSNIFVNKTSGYFFCIACKKSGSWNILETAITNPNKFNNIPLAKSVEDGKSKWLRLSKKLCLFSNLSDGRKEDLLRTHIGIELLSVEKFGSFSTLVDINTNSVYFPLENDGEIVGYKILRGGEEQTFPQNSACGIISIKKNSDAALLVDNLKDFLTLSLYELKEDVICLPHGSHHLPQSVLPLFEHYDKLTLWFGSSFASWDNARIFARKFCSNRCYLIRPLEDQTSVYNAHLKNEKIPRIISEASCVAHPSIITFHRIREDIAAELHNAEKVSGVKWQRFPSLNSVLKGHRRGELTILTGPTGSGKTTFMSEYSLDLAMQKVTTLWGSFEIRNQRLAKTMLQQMVLESLETNLDRFDFWADNFEQLPIYFMTFHGQQQLSSVLETVQHATYVHDVSHVIIDNVQFMLGLSSRESGFLDRFSRQDQLIAAFRNFASVYNCHVTLVIHPRKERDDEPLTANSIFGGAKASQEADNILIIQNRPTHSSLKVKKYLQIAKNRFSGDVGMMPLDFDKSTLSFREKSTK